MLNDWYADGARRAASDMVRADLLKAAEALGPRHVKAGGEVGGIDWSLDRLADDFHRLCEQAAGARTRNALKPMPFGQIRDPRIGIDLIDEYRNPGSPGPAREGEDLP
jgi:hypothetical protein